MSNQSILNISQKIPNFDYFPWGMWLVSRLVILASMLGIAPLLPPLNPEHPIALGWQVFNQWDSKIYEEIVKNGYIFVENGANNTAFLPLFPLLIKILTLLGIPFAIAGFLLNNLLFLLAVLVLYFWMKERYSPRIARWIIAVFVWCPFSLFGTVIYTEGSFLLWSILALRAFEKEQYPWAVCWSILATATRVPALALAPAFLLTAWLEKRSYKAYLTALFAPVGFIFFLAYCAWQLGNFFAFFMAQKSWVSPHWLQLTWIKMAFQITIGPGNIQEDSIRFSDPWHPLLFLLFCLLSFGLWKFRHRLGVKATYLFWLLWIGLWILAGMPLINAMMVGGGMYLLWHFRTRLSTSLLCYGWLSYGVILAAQRTTSAERYVYGIVSISIALGLLLARYPRWGYFTLGFFGFLLANYSIRFAQGLWVG